jgi:hypothetical protein
VRELATVFTEAAEVSTAEMGSATKVRSAGHSATAATMPALGQRACCHRRRAKRDGRCNNKDYLTHDGILPFGDAATRKMMPVHCSKIEAERALAISQAQ